ncbi:type I-E CRISPR-associated protein Cse2/CasB (plasmid) [Streptomyces poriferorum]|uniref:type I-E CRISPR-associated protein Cse2/CasB n=1 Tax=Streptomyces poriferorum TaxID=2798799 RepID=UPI00273D85A9|nr:type I-E CRISPR-associated protein Cse2/CasB [Streptomyces sp. Alt1]WLQ53793.1 type I-E CRISPR-associated protein Cse2/CasB [Streptomyces sp. Alt1]
MTTALPLTASQRVRETTNSLIRPLQRDLLSDRPHAVAALARLRRGAGKDTSQVPDLWGLIDIGPLHDRPQDGGRPFTEEQLTRAEDAVHTALTLWALHQQSRGHGMHQSGTHPAHHGLGAAVRRLMPPGEIAEPVRKRLVRAGTAPDLPQLAQRLRDLVLLLRGQDIPLDYALLAEQLYQWQAPGGRDTVRRAWGRSFHAHRGPQDTPQAGVPSPAASPEHDNTADKDAP